MSQVDQVALWAGLISSIVGIVLSVVAIVASIFTSIRSENVSNQTIKSLQKIESEVERISQETTGLIKAGWERMLGMTAGAAPLTTTPSSAKEIAEGLTKEIRAALQDANNSGADQLPKIESSLREIRNTIAAQMSTGVTSAQRNGHISIDQRIGRLPDVARELAYRIKPLHLTRTQYKALRDDKHVGSSVQRLRKAGILVPLSGHREDGSETSPVIWFPPDASDDIRAALILSRPESAETREIVDAHLKAIKYNPPD